MKFATISFLAFLLFGMLHQVHAQAWVESMQDRSANFYTIQQEFNTAWGNKAYVRGQGWKQYKRWEDFWEPRVFPHGIRPLPDHAWKEHLAFKRTYPANPKATARSSNWTSMGPFSWTNSSYNPGIGRINVVAEDPNDPNTIYVGAPAGGCWKSTDAGSSWTVLTDDFQSLGVSAIAIDPTNSNVVYIGTGDDDANDTYSIGLFKSLDGGASWNEVTPSSASIFGTRVYKIIIHPTDNNTIFIASSTGCHKSTDGGNTWTLLRTGAWRDMELKPGDPSVMYLCNKTFYRSTNGGLSWSPVSTGLPSSFVINRAEIAVSAANADYVYFLCGDANDASFYGLYRSDNQGASFALQSNAPNIFASDFTGTNTGGQSWYDMALAANPANAEEIYVGGINVWKSTNGGATFTIKSHWVYPPNVAYTHADIHTLEVIGNNVYCGSDGGIFRSTNGGNSFANLSDGLAITQLYAIGGSDQVPHKVMGGTQDNGCNLMSNGHALHTNGGDGMEVMIAPNDSLVIYTSSQYGGFRRSDDGGYNSNAIFPTERGNGAWVTPLAMNPQDNDMLIAGFDQVYLSLDKGNSDQPISSFSIGGSLLRHVAIAPSDGYTHFYAGTYDDLFMTTNSGANWTDIANGLPNASISSITVHPNNPLKVWLTFSGSLAGHKVYMTEDGGTTWMNITANLPNLPINCLVYQNGSADGLYIGTDIGVYYTDTLLAGWQQFTDGLPNVIVRDLEINYTVGKIRAGTYGRGLWESNVKPPLTASPVANFAYSSSQVCTSDSIAFTDTSLDHAPGWTWYFPGGSPSSSTQRNPKVAYPTTGIYNVTLVVQNINGVDSVTKAVPVTYQPNILGFDLQLDNGASEVAWNIKDATGATIYSSALFALSGQDSAFIQTPICLNAGCFTLTMIDVGANGLCCGNGMGHYLLTNATGDTLAVGSNYGSSDTTTFCVNQVTPMATGASISHATCGASDGMVTMTAIGGDGNFQFSIDSGATFQSSNTFSNLAAGNYSILVQDGLGQQIYTPITITVTGIPIAMASATATTLYMNQGGVGNFFSTNSSNATTILWTFPGGSTSNQASPNFTFITDGVQQVILTVSNGSCSHSDTLDINVIDNVNIDQIENNTSINIIPNPVQDKFLLDIEFMQTQPLIEIVIHNALGQRVFWQEVEQVKTFSRHIHLGNEADGVYILTVLSKGDKGGAAISRKFIKG